MVQRTILRLAFPGGEVRPKPGPYRGGDGVSTSRANGSSNGHVRREAPGENGSGPEQASAGVRFDMPSED